MTSTTLPASKSSQPMNMWPTFTTVYGAFAISLTMSGLMIGVLWQKCVLLGLMTLALTLTIKSGRQLLNIMHAGHLLPYPTRKTTITGLWSAVCAFLGTIGMIVASTWPWQYLSGLILFLSLSTATLVILRSHVWVETSIISQVRNAHWNLIDRYLSSLEQNQKGNDVE